MSPAFLQLSLKERPELDPSHALPGELLTHMGSGRTGEQNHSARGNRCEKDE